ncbi:MAG: TonB-dependent receptor, partial [Chromatiales bacterium]|nr:TonB-dependent receptor [Chromatiales bacterium]
MNRSAARTGLACSILGLLPFTPAGAADREMAPIIVTASRTAETADETLASVTVIDRETIEKSQATDITELLIGIAGINLSANGGDGKNKSLFLRGTNSNHTLLLIDGIRIGSATLGSPSWSLIPLHDIERIEVVRGPRSSLYGSDAIGGVIQIFTRKGGEGLRTSTEAGYGTDNHYKLEGSLSYGNESSRFRLAISKEETDGYDVRPAIEQDDDGFDSLGINGSFSHKFTDRLELSGNILRSDGENEFDGNSFSGNLTEFIQQSAGLALTADVTDGWKSTLRFGESRDFSKNFFNDTFVNKFDTQRRQIAWENSIDLNDSNQIVAGVDYYKDEINATTDYAETERDNKALFGQYRYFGERHDLQLGLRYDDNEQFGDQTTGNIAWGMEVMENLRFTASAGTAFKAPTFNDLYWPSSPWSSGNPDLVPEKSRSYELGLSGQHAGVHWSARTYRSNIKNLINWACTDLCTDSDPFNDFWQPSNVD